MQRRVPCPAAPRRAGHAGGDPARGGRDAGLRLLTLMQSGRWEEHEDINSGDFIYIPAGIPHLPYNPSETETCTAVIARTDPNEQESVKLLPELDGIHC